MAPRNVAPPAQKVPEDPLWIEFTRSDGEQRNWPSNTTYIVDANGEINWMAHVPIDGDTALKWRLSVGNAVALDSFGVEQSKRAVLKDWPANYRMYNHHKGKAGSPRQDIYLYGPQSKRFRSIKEFIPHAIWLYRDKTMDTLNCYCKYCTKLPQRVISTALDSIIQSSSQTSISAPPRTQGAGPSNAAGPSSSTPTPGGRDIYSALQKQGWARRERDRDSTSLAQRKAQREQKVKQSKGKGKDEPAPKVFASVQKQLKPMSELKPSDNVSDMPMLADRNRDLRAVYSRSANDKMGVLGWDDDNEAALPSVEVQSGMAAPPSQPNKDNPTLRRYFRENEIVWVQLPGQGIPMASLGAAQDLNISVWPGMVKGSKIKNTPIPVSQPNSISGPSNASGSAYSPHPQGKPSNSASTTNGTLNSHVRSVPVTSSAGLSAHSEPSHATGQFPPTASPLCPQSSVTPAGAQPSAANVSLPSPTPNSSSSGLPAANVPISHAASPAPNASGQPISTTPSLPSRVHNTAATTASAVSGSQSENSGNWIVRESIVYTVQLTGVDVRSEVPATNVLPYLATAPADDIVQWLKVVPEYLNFDREWIRTFDPLVAARQAEQGQAAPEDPVEAASRAISAYALALQTASHVCNDWSLTDKWDYEYVPPGYETGNVRISVVTNSASPQPGTSAFSPQPTLPQSISAPMRTNAHLTTGLSLASAIQDAGRANAEGPTSFSQKKSLNTIVGTGPVYEEISGTSNSMTEQEVRQTAAGVLGVGPGDAASSSANQEGLIQVRFQGMWWGSERIWVDDFVRIKIPRGALAPDGAPNVYKPCGRGKKNRELDMKAQELLRGINGGSAEGGNERGNSAESDSLGVHSVLSRGVFMKVGGIFVADVPKPDGSRKKEGRVCGMLYELADLDWEETELDLREQYELEKQQRIEYLSRRAEAKDAVAMFKASVDESLLPSNSNKPSSMQAPPQQPSPPNHYIMPQAPKGYRFRPILKTGYEAVLNLSLISGRYYPRLIGHPLLAPKFIQDFSEPQWDMDEKLRTDILGLMSLEGLAAGHYNAVDPQFHKKSRVQMLEDAEQAAFQDMAFFKNEQIRQREGEEDHDMDEDVDVEMAVDELSMNVD